MQTFNGKRDEVNMVTSMQLTGKDIESLKDVLVRYKEFNELNEDLYGTYTKSSILVKFQYRTGLRIISYKSNPAMIIWSEARNYSSKIRAIIPFDYLYTITDPGFFSEVIFAFKSTLSIHLDIRRFEYMAVLNETNEKILTAMVFQVKKGILVMHLNLKDAINPTKPVELKKFRMEDIKDRVNIQNNIFDNKNRIPINSADILMEISRKSYIQELSLFLVHDSELAGYGQITNHNGKAFLVNFGIVDRFRGMRLSKDFLLAILKEAKDYGFIELNLEVRADNKRAVDLYTSVGFTISYNTATWVYNEQEIPE